MVHDHGDHGRRRLADGLPGGEELPVRAARRDITAGDLIAGIRIAGAATFVAETMTEGAQALVY